MSSPRCGASAMIIGDRVLIGEIYLPLERLVAYYGKDLTGAHLPFNFALLSTAGTRARSKAHRRVRGGTAAGAWPNWVLGNHDRPRLASRIGPRAGARCRHAAADTARHADALLRRRDRHAAACRSRPSTCVTPSRRTCPASASAATVAARRCNGMRRSMRGFRRSGRGCRWLPISATTTSPSRSRSTIDPEPVSDADRVAPQPARACGRRLPAAVCRRRPAAVSARGRQGVTVLNLGRAVRSSRCSAARSAVDIPGSRGAAEADLSGRDLAARPSSTAERECDRGGKRNRYCAAIEGRRSSKVRISAG